jgi:endonuclease YncB( thermonuclease family)
MGLKRSVYEIDEKKARRRGSDMGDREVRLAGTDAPKKHQTTLYDHYNFGAHL